MSTRWRLELFRKGEDDPFVSIGEYAERINTTNTPASSLSLRVQIAVEDERVDRIEIVREP